MKNSVKSNKLDYLLAAPTLIWLTIFFLVPYLIVLIYGFLTPDIFDVKFEFNLDAYRQLLDGTYFRPFLLSVRLAITSHSSSHSFSFENSRWPRRSSQ